jgi:hypothetical protein
LQFFAFADIAFDEVAEDVEFPDIERLVVLAQSCLTEFWLLSDVLLDIDPAGVGELLPMLCVVVLPPFVTPAPPVACRLTFGRPRKKRPP